MRSPAYAVSANVPKPSVGGAKNSGVAAPPRCDPILYPLDVLRARRSEDASGGSPLITETRFEPRRPMLCALAGGRLQSAAQLSGCQVKFTRPPLVWKSRS